MIIQDYPSYLNFPGFYFNATLNADELKHRLPLGTRSYDISVFASLCTSFRQYQRGKGLKSHQDSRALSLVSLQPVFSNLNICIYIITHSRCIGLCLCIYKVRIILYQNRIIVMNAMHVSEFLAQIDMDYMIHIHSDAFLNYFLF